MAGEIRFRQPKDAQGRFLKFSSDIEDLMYKEAKEYQYEVAKYISDHTKRKSDSTGRLVGVTTSPHNRDVRKITWRVGIPGFLNRSEAKYWRLIEQGSAGLYGKGRGFRGTPLKLRPGGFPGGRPFRSFPRGIVRTRSNGRNRNGSINLNRGTVLAPGVYLVYVKREIQPMDAYRQTFIQGQWRRRIQRDFEQSVRRSFLR